MSVLKMKFALLFALKQNSKTSWTPKIGKENFCLKSENENQHDKCAVVIVLEERIVEHVSKKAWVKYSINFKKFLTAPSDAK